MACDTSVFLFVHIAKTGGTTLRTFFAQAMDPHQTFIHLGEPTYAQEKMEGLCPFAERPLEHRQRARVVMGHDVTIRTHELVPNRVPRYIAFLRDPADRLISFYNFDMSRRQRKQEPIVDFEEWYGDDKKYDKGLKWLYRYVLLERHPRLPNARMYQRTVRALERFWFVGCTEFLDRDIPLLLQFIGVQGVPRKANVSGVTFPKVLEGDETLRNRLREENALDYALYQHFRERREERVSELQQALRTGVDSRAGRGGGGLMGWLRGRFF